MRLAAIDIGSNAARLLLVRVSCTRQGPHFRKEAFIRMPIRKIYVPLVGLGDGLVHVLYEKHQNARLTTFHPGFAPEGRPPQ